MYEGATCSRGNVVNERGRKAPQLLVPLAFSSILARSFSIPNVVLINETLDHASNIILNLTICKTQNNTSARSQFVISSGIVRSLRVVNRTVNLNNKSPRSTIEINKVIWQEHNLALKKGL